MDVKGVWGSRTWNLTLILEMDMRMILLALVAEAFLEEALSKDKAPWVWKLDPARYVVQMYRIVLSNPKQPRALQCDVPSQCIVQKLSVVPRSIEILLSLIQMFCLHCRIQLSHWVDHDVYLPQFFRQRSEANTPVVRSGQATVHWFGAWMGLDIQFSQRPPVNPQT